MISNWLVQCVFQKNKNTKSGAKVSSGNELPRRMCFIEKALNLGFFPPTTLQWVVSPADKAKYDDLFSKTDGDMDGLVSGPEVRDIFLKTGLPSATLARIW